MAVSDVLGIDSLPYIPSQGKRAIIVMYDMSISEKEQSIM